MATQLTKPVRRETSLTDRKGRRIIAILDADNTITFKPKGLRRTVTVYLGHCFMLAQIMDAEDRYKKAVEAYKVKKAHGARARKPIKPSLPFGKVYFDALK